MKIIFKFFLICALFPYSTFSQSRSNDTLRGHILMDYNWRFSFGNPDNTKKDFNNGTSYFSYLSKAGYGDGAAAFNFDDRSWRKLDLPHDWAVEQRFDSKASFSHGFKAIGRNFPEKSVGWYRKSFTIPVSEKGKHISIAFDGVFRNSIVWVNGHYLGTEPSGYNGFEYNISEYLNYGSVNIIAVRVDATMEEGWFYEGAGIYRHVWLNITDPLHVATNGTYITTRLRNNLADITAVATINNDDRRSRSFDITQVVIDKSGKEIAKDIKKGLVLQPFTAIDVKNILTVANPKLWSIDTPYLHKLITIITEDGHVTDRYQTTFGIRTIKFDANRGFFLNGRHIEIKGTNNHQDHAGVGTALPDGLQDFRIQALKTMGSNAYRCSHNPPTPELLDACDKYGMLVIDENRLMGVSSTELNELKRLIIRDRNHPSIISWSIGNEEWGIENSETGANIATTMQAFAKSIDSSRYITAAFSGGVGLGISNVMDLMGYNYVSNKNTDEHHKAYPEQFSWGTEEGSTVATRGIYSNDSAKHQRAAYDQPQNNRSLSIEQGWTYYAKRPYLAGMFVWTGFDYRGEPTPFGWPSIESYFGMMDACGFPKDDYYYLKSWWSNEPTIHILPHWNWPGKKNQPISVWVYSNADEVELFLNKKSMGKKSMERNSHLEWTVNYSPGSLLAIGYKNGKAIMRDEVKTTGAASALNLSSNVGSIPADKEAVAVINVDASDKHKMHVPTAGNEVHFSIQGPGKIIGVGNGDPTSLEPDKYLDTIKAISITDLKEKVVNTLLNQRPEIPVDFDDSNWKNAFEDRKEGGPDGFMIYRGQFILSVEDLKGAITLFYNSLGKQQSVFINGKNIASDIPQNTDGNSFKLDSSMLKTGVNYISILTTSLHSKNSGDHINRNPGLIQVVQPAGQWKRKLFNGLEQVIIESTGEPGEIILKANSPGLQSGEVDIQVSSNKSQDAIN